MVSLARHDDRLRVDVADNGVGISEADQEIIFDKFRQVGDTLTRKPKGSGLGLAISREIIQHFGGRLWVTSRLGAGSTFSLHRPDPAAVPRLEAAGRTLEPKLGT